MPKSIPAKKGQLIVFEQAHSYTSLKDGTTRYTKWHVGVVAKTSRAGEVKAIRHGNLTRPFDTYAAPCLVACSVDGALADGIADALRLAAYDTADGARQAVKALLAA